MAEPPAGHAPGLVEALGDMEELLLADPAGVMDDPPEHAQEVQWRLMSSRWAALPWGCAQRAFVTSRSESRVRLSMRWPTVKRWDFGMAAVRWKDHASRSESAV